MPKEPQSYGSQEDWVSGDVGETVNKQKRTPPPAEEEFYDDRRSSEAPGPNQGGHVSDVQLEENDDRGLTRAAPSDEQPVTKVTDEKGGAKRGGFFKDRDYTPQK